MCASAHIPGNDKPDKSSARTRQAVQQRVEVAYAYGPHMLVHNQHVLDVPLLEDRLFKITNR
jgi:hypothetical protein